MKKIAIILIIIVILAALTAIAFDRLVIFAVSKYAGIGISYSGLIKDSSGAIIMKGLDVEDHRRGLGLMAKRAIIRLRLKPFFKDGVGFIFELDEANFKMFSKGPKASGLDEPLRDIALIPFEGGWNYSKISGEISIMRGETRIKDFFAASRDIRLGVDGTAYGDDLIDARIKISFSKSAVERLPEELTNVVMNEEPEGWRTISIDLKGNPKKPSITFSSKLFRLNITNR